jgi:hypothetical protein
VIPLQPRSCLQRNPALGRHSLDAGADRIRTSRYRDDSARLAKTGETFHWTSPAKEALNGKDETD